MSPTRGQQSQKTAQWIKKTWKRLLTHFSRLCGSTVRLLPIDYIKSCLVRRSELKFELWTDWRSWQPSMVNHQAGNKGSKDTVLMRLFYSDVSFMSPLICSSQTGLQRCSFNAIFPTFLISNEQTLFSRHLSPKTFILTEEKLKRGFNAEVQPLKNTLDLNMRDI